MILIRQAPTAPYWHVEAVAVEYPNGERHMVWGTALAHLGIEHPEVLAQLTKP